MEGWICESCVYYPPSACDGKPYCACDTSDPVTSCYQGNSLNTKEEEISLILRSNNRKD